MKVRIALVPRTSEGEPCPTPVIVLMVRDRYGASAELKFRVDTQADVTTVPIGLAEKECIPFSKGRPGTGRGIAGKIAKYRDRIRVLLAGREHDWPCDFTEPAIDAETRQPLRDLSPVLGRAGFLDEYAVTIDSDYLIITRLGPIRRWLRRRMHQLWKLFGMVHSVDRPL
jgi:hypothetical protein